MFEKDFFKNASEFWSFLKKFVLKAQKYKTTEKDAKRLLQEEVKKKLYCDWNLGRPVTCRFLDLLPRRASLTSWSAAEDLWLSSLALVSVFLNDET